MTEFDEVLEVCEEDAKAEAVEAAMIEDGREEGTNGEEV